MAVVVGFWVAPLLPVLLAGTIAFLLAFCGSHFLHLSSTGALRKCLIERHVLAEWPGETWRAVTVPRNGKCASDLKKRG